MPDDAPSAQLVITCVHGTWGRGFFPAKASQLLRRAPTAKPLRRRWFEPESAFRQNLEQALYAYGLRAVFEPFEWSGANSIFERDEAGEALAELLRGQPQRFPGHARVVIAHSHGGNIAMRALHRMQHTETEIRVITLATPFVEVFFTPGGNLDARTIRTLGFALLITVGMALHFLQRTLWVLKNINSVSLDSAIWLAVFGVLRRESTIARWLFFGCLAGSFMSFVFAVTGVSAFPFVHSPTELMVALVVVLLGAAVGLFARLDRGARAVAHWFLGPVAAPRQKEPQFDASARRLSKASVLPAVRLPTQGILVLRGVDDEAALALAAGTIGARLSRIMVAVLTRVAPLVLWSTAVFSVSFLILGAAWGSHWTELEPVQRAIDLLLDPKVAKTLLSWPVFLILVVLLCCTFKSVHGRELLHGSVVLDVVSNSTPDCLGNLDTMTLPHHRRASGWLRHSLYDHPSVGRIVAAWLAASRGAHAGKESFGSLIDGNNTAREDRS